MLKSNKLLFCSVLFCENSDKREKKKENDKKRRKLLLYQREI